MLALAERGIELWFDIYSPNPDEDGASSSSISS
jgi:hypothetical protein